MVEFSEKDLEDLIFNSKRSELEKRGLKINGTLKRQLRIGNYGICDLISIVRPFYCPIGMKYYRGTVTIYELKKGCAGVSALVQSLRYAIGVKNYLENRELSHYFDIEICLIGSYIDTGSAMYYLPNIYNICNSEIDGNINLMFRFYTTEFNVDGLRFKEISYTGLKDEGFNF